MCTKSRTGLLLGLAVILSQGGCLAYQRFVMPAKLYDLQGARVLDVQVNRTMNGAGLIYSEIDGEHLEGEYATHANTSTSISLGTGSAQAYSGQQSVSAWAQTMGFGYNEEGMQYGSFVMIGDRGTTIEGEYKGNPNLSHGVWTGFARDNRGRTYKYVIHAKERTTIPEWAKKK